MKVINRLKFVILPALCLCMVLSSCSREYAVDDTQYLRGTRLAIRIPNMNESQTRAVPAGFDNIDNLNIFITQGDLILDRLYIDINDIQNPIKENEGGEVIFEQDGAGGSVVYSSEWLGSADITSSTSNFVVVANYGEIDEGMASTLPQLKKLKDVGESGYVNQNRVIMYGESGTNGETSKQVWLKRTSAMITVAIDARQLDPNIEITPLTISLHNVPTECFIGVNEYNIVTDGPLDAPYGTNRIPGAVADFGDRKNVSSWGTVTSGGTVGGHYAGLDYTDGSIVPLFMYENYHGGSAFGEDENVTEQTKRPNGCASDEGSIEAATQACSYLQVTARYKNATHEGDATYRVFLGKDKLRDFDVMRNSYHKVTLRLFDTGIGEDGYSWRLETDLAQSGGSELKESDFTFNGNGEHVFVLEAEEAGQTSSEYGIEYDTARWGNSDPFVYIRIASNQGVRQGWMRFPATNGTLGRIGREGDQRNGLRMFDIYVEPMLPGINWDYTDGVVRQVTFRFTAGTGGAVDTEWVTITQYAPIAIPLDKHKGNPDIEAKVAGLGWSMDGTLYIDRLDSQSLPWGFGAIQITANGGSGIGNGTNLMQVYGTTADDYLPYGLTNGGSAVMDAAFSRYYQRSGTGNTGSGLGAMLDSPSINNILSYTPPANYPQNYFLPSVAEWELLDMIHRIEGEALFDGEDYQIGFFDNYWTSDADTTNGSRNSYTYMMGTRASDGTVHSTPRTTSTVYRKMYYIP